MWCSRLPIKLLSCPSYISQFVSFVQKWLLSPGLTKGRKKRHLFHKHKEPLWRRSPLFTFKHSFWCQWRSIEICLHGLFKKKKEICTGGWETEQALVPYFCNRLCCKKSAANSGNSTQEEDDGWQNGHGTNPGWKRDEAPCVHTGASVVAQVMDACTLPFSSAVKWTY